VRNECNKIFFSFEKKNIKNIILSDKNELAEIFILSSLDTNIKIVGLLGEASNYLGVPVYKKLPKSLKIDAVIVTAMQSVDERYDDLKKIIDTDKILIPSILKNNIKGEK